jgi:4-carboxymuconolactone decarboxylase
MSTDTMTHRSDAKSFYETWPARMSAAKAAGPDIAKGFGSMFGAVMKEGTLTAVQKELIALGIGLAVRCDNCLYAHIQKCVQLGATRQQILETAGVAVMMQGGPTYTYLPKVVEALDALNAA